ncbi:MAG: Holliday junction branch migration protein RuvA [Parcubacteria group bacterium]|nr:Holliday junction branch migration protein RuvA [Parcubacteria group bacterium]
MIARLRGTVAAIREHDVVLDVSGVGYRIFATPATRATLKEGASTTLNIYTAVREDALDLYGFLEDQERRMFELLLSVSGIGPKSALSILSLAGIDTLASAIGAGKATYLTNVSGIGKKTAEKIVLELKDKIESLGIIATGHEGDEGTLEALRGLGYSLKEARDALAQVDDDVVGEGARLTAALRSLGGKKK